MNLGGVSAFCQLFRLQVDRGSKCELACGLFVVITQEESFLIRIRIIQQVNHCLAKLIVIEFCIKLVHFLKDGFQENKHIFIQTLDSNIVWGNYLISI